MLVVGASCTLSSGNKEGAGTQTGQESINATVVISVNTPVIDGTDAPSPSSFTESAATIRMTKEGFVPSSVTVKRGQTVRWVNAESQPHWLASDPHPSHTDNPDLDSLHELAQGETYLYTFMKSGMVRYHDHLNPQYLGTVVVE